MRPTRLFRKAARSSRPQIVAADIPDRIQIWLQDPNGGAKFLTDAFKILQHDRNCSSLPLVWLPRIGGRTVLGDIGECDGCDITFYVDGLRTEGDVDLCACCRERRQRMKSKAVKTGKLLDWRPRWLRSTRWG